jgi:hypothetical protein
MEELFRFSVLRPVETSVPRVALLGTQPPTNGRTPATPGQTFEHAVQSVLAKPRRGETNENIWNQLEPPAAAYLVAATATITGDPLWAALAAFNAALTALGAGGAPAPDAAAIEEVFAAGATKDVKLVAPYQLDLGDLFLAQVIVRRGGSARLAELLPATPGLSTVLNVALVDVATRLRSAVLALAGPQPLVDALAGATDAKAAFNLALQAALNATILLPPSLTAALKRPVLGVGFREMHVVKQHIRRYQASEIARIENILKGESRDHEQKHTLSTETDTFVQTVDTTESDKELDTDDKTSIQNEADDQLKTDTKVDGGVHAQYSGPSYKLNADLTASYDRASETTQKYSANTAKEVTQKAATKITDQVTQSQTTKIKEKLVDLEKQKFDNVQGAKNVVGVYQWIEKVYLSQVFNLGRHLLIDITVPEPGGNLLALATQSSQLSPGPTQPRPLGTILVDGQGKAVLDQFGQLQLDKPLNPLDLSENPADANFYGTWVALYGATGVTAPPPPAQTYTKGKAFDYKDDDDKQVADTITIDDGYEGVSVSLIVSGERNDNPEGDVWTALAIGNALMKLAYPGGLGGARAEAASATASFSPHVTGTVDFTIYGRQYDQMVSTIEIQAVRTAGAYDAWRLATYEKIAAAYQNLETAYQTALSKQQMATQTVGPLGAADPDANRATERQELKRSCIAIFDNSNATVAGSEVMQLNPAIAPTTPDPANPQLPEPVLSTAQSLGARVRWFEQAFEWENVAYVVYPYYWGRRELWLERFRLTNDDPLFLNFLQAGYARVVVPVRIGFEQAVQFYLNTGLPWLGGDLPVVGDDSANPLYLDVAEEIKALTGGGEEGDLDVPIGIPWEYVLPTTTIMLREDGKLPEWHRIDASGVEGPDAPSDAPPDPWTWLPGAPTI